MWIGIGALAGLGAVAMAALSAHGLAWLGPNRLQMVRSAVQMQGWHALAVIFCGLWTPQGGVLVDCAAGAFVAGMVLFCASIYALALGGAPVGPVVPVGGALLLAGWGLLALSALRRR